MWYSKFEKNCWRRSSLQLFREKSHCIWLYWWHWFRHLFLFFHQKNVMPVMLSRAAELTGLRWRLIRKVWASRSPGQMGWVSAGALGTLWEENWVSGPLTFPGSIIWLCDWQIIMSTKRKDEYMNKRGKINRRAFSMLRIERLYHIFKPPLTLGSLTSPQYGRYMVFPIFNK